MQHLLKNNNFVRFWIAQALVGVGDTLYMVGVIVKVFEQTGSALQATGVLISTYLPLFLLGPLAGALVDRYPRQRVLIAGNTIQAGLVGLLLLFVNETEINLWGVYIIVAGLASVTAFYQPARMAIIPSLVPRQDLVRANSILVGTRQGTMALGFLIGGFLVLRLSFPTFVIIDLILFLAAAGLMTFLRVARRSESERKDSSESASVWQSIGAGYQALQKNDVARPLIWMEVLEHVPHGIWTSALLLVFIETALGGDADLWGYISGLYFGAMLIGAAIATLVAKRLEAQAGWVIISNACLSGVLTFLFAISPTVWMVAIVVFAFGPPMAVRDVAQDTLLQASVDEEMMGRIYALRETFRNIAFMLSGLFFAWLADFVSIRWIYGVGGILYVGTALYALSSVALRNSRIDTQTVPSVLTMGDEATRNPAE